MSDYERRDFLKSFGFLAAAPMILPSRVWSGADLPSNRLNIGVIGIGKQGSGLLQSFLHAPGTQIVTVCDVDRKKLARAQKWTDDYYAEKNGASYKACNTTVDFRDIIADKNINIIILAAPDHWHAIPSILAARSGKDIYCEKPLTLTIDEGKHLVEVQKQTNRILQTGTQQRSSVHFRLAMEISLPIASPSIWWNIGVWVRSESQR